MTEIRFYGEGLAGYTRTKPLPGRLIVLEGTDGVGRSTQIALLREWVESQGYAVQATGLKRSALAGEGIKKAMDGHTLGNITANLFYATDMVDRLEKVIIPALRAGFVVLTDRYIYSIIARAIVRGVDPVWIRDVFGFALAPDAVLYLHADLPHLIPRVLNARGFDYWESGMDFLPQGDYFDAFIEYQSRLLAQFEAMVEEYDFRQVDATQSIREVFHTLIDEIGATLADMKPVSPKKAEKELAGVLADMKAAPAKKVEKEPAEAASGATAEEETKKKKQKKP
ncbi:MAG: thymidylate kinase [Anaerolineae bacterium]|nr:thymidylate kinase [Anaerolineae bacterium]